MVCLCVFLIDVGVIFGASYPRIKCNDKSYPTETEAICTEKEKFYLYR